RPLAGAPTAGSAGPAGSALPILEALHHLLAFLRRHVRHPLLEPPAAFLLVRGRLTPLALLSLLTAALTCALRRRRAAGLAGSRARLRLTARLPALRVLAAASAAAEPAASAAERALDVGRDRLIERRERVGRRTETQRCVGHAQHVRAARDLDVDVRRHARLQLELWVRHVDDGRVGDDVLHHL